MVGGGRRWNVLRRAIGNRCRSNGLRLWIVNHRWDVHCRRLVARRRWVLLMDGARIWSATDVRTTAWAMRTGLVARVWEPDWRAEAGSLVAADWFG